MSEINKEVIKEMINECMQELVGDKPVSCQLDVALRAHKHGDYPTREEYEELKAEVQRLTELVGNTSVADQINAAFNG